MHVNLAHRDKFALHYAAGLYIIKPQDSYICHKVWVKETKIVRIVDTVFFNHKYLKNMTITTSNKITQSADDISSVVDNNIPQTNDSNKSTKTVI